MTTKKTSSTKAKTTKKRGAKTKEEKYSIDERIIELIESGEILRMSNIEIGKRVGLTRKSVPARVRAVYNNMKAEDINKVLINTDVLFRNMTKEAKDIMDQSGMDYDMKLKAIDKICKIVDSRTDFMEKFNIKPKVADVVEAKGFDNINIQVLPGVSTIEELEKVQKTLGLKAKKR